jgi:hypothetical protein
MRIRFFTGTAIAMLLALTHTNAQQVQVPFDEAGRILRVTPEIEAALHLFPGYPMFKEARMFRQPDSSYVIDIEYVAQRAPAREQKCFSAAEGELYRRELSLHILRSAPELGLDQQGRTKFLIGIAGLGFGFYSWAMPVMLNVDDGAAIVGLFMLTGGGTYLYSLALTRDSRVTDGMATCALQGGGRGIVDGMLIGSLFSAEPDFRSQVSLCFFLSIGELFAGYHLASAYDLSPGNAATISAGGNFGLGIGAASALMLNNERSIWENKTVGALGLLGSAAGYAGGAMLAASSHYTPGDADVLTSSGLLGAAIPVSALYLAGVTDERPLFGVAAAGALGGLAFGHVFLNSRDFSSSQGTYVYFSTVAGGLVGAGLGFTFASDTHPERLIAAATAAGAATGFGLMLASLDDEARAASKASAWNVTISPLGLASMLNHAESAHWRPPPLLLIEARF